MRRYTLGILAVVYMVNFLDRQIMSILLPALRVEFEAKQQIPFALEDVIWDYQMLVGGVDADGMALENEVGLFAMKRDQVLRAIRPLDDAGIEIDVIQLSPVCVFNTAVHNVLENVPKIEDYDPDDPPPSVVVLSMGTDTTDLVVTNGLRVWQRSIPLGGNHFTKQLTKELKLTFAKAEHLKRNSREAEDPKKDIYMYWYVSNYLEDRLWS